MTIEDSEKNILNAPLEEIAIVGMSCRLPGRVNSPQEFFDFLLDGGDGIVKVPSDRWENDAYYDADKTKTNKMYVDQGGFIENIDHFDPQFFGISPKEAPHIDPQHRWLLELTYEAFENAGINVSELKGSDTAVYMGQFMHDYEQVQLSPGAHKLMNGNSATGPSMTLTANRISYTFDFTGPSVSLDTACSSSLVALDLACKAILNGDSEIGVAGGVNILLRPELTMSICKASMLSPDCRCKSFDASANGYVRSEGAGVVLVKKKVDAERDGDNILAIIKATGVNQDGQTIGITVPNGDSQKLLLRKSLKRAGLKAQDIQYAEAHGTGTAVGDPIEVNALGQTLGARNENDPQCVIGSVKSNIGHSEATAGVAGLIKTVMAMREGTIPKNIHYNTTNPAINLEKLNLHIASDHLAWPDVQNKPRRAMVNSFGFGGTNSNVILEQAPDQVVKVGTQAPVVNGTIKLLPISSKTEKGLKDQAQKYVDYLKDNVIGQENIAGLLHDVCYSASLRREHFKYRLTVSGATAEELIEGLSQFIDGTPTSNVIQDIAQTEPENKTCFVFSGMGPQWSGMGRALYNLEPVYKAAIERCSDALQEHSGWSLVDAIFNTEDSEKINETWIAQPAIFATQVAIAELLASWGVKPGCIVGHSAGEVGAAYMSGALSFDDAIKVIYHRSRLQHTTEGMGKMLAVGLSEHALQEYLVGIEDKVSIAAVNSQEAITLAGDPEALEKIAQQLDDKGVFARFLNVGVPYHSPVMDRLKAPLKEVLEGIDVLEPHTTIYSTVSAKVSQEGDWGANYWPHNVREPVRFQAAIEQIYADGFDCFVEIAPHPVLSSSITNTLSKSRTAATLNRKLADDVALNQTLASLHVKGMGIDWAQLYPNAGQLVSLPNYAWQHASYWSETEDAQRARLKNIHAGDAYAEPVHPLLGSPVNTNAEIWQKSVDLQELSYLEGHQVAEDIVYPGAAYIESALAIASEQRKEKGIEGEASVTLENVEFLRAFFLDKNNPVKTESRLVNNTQDFEISALDASSAWSAFCRGSISDIAKQKPSTLINLDEITSSLSRHMDKEAFYAHCHELGLCYKDAFALVEQAWYEDDECVVEVCLPEGINDAHSDYSLHPVLLDGAFQGLFPTVQKGYLPVKIEALHFYQQPGQRFYCHLLTDYKDENDIVGRLALFDTDGNLLVEIEGIALKARQPSATSEITASTLEYDYSWEEKVLGEAEEEGAATKSNTGEWLILADRTGVADNLVKELEERGEKCHVIADSGAIQSSEDFLPVMQGLAKTCSGIIYLWALDNAPCENQSAQEVLDSCHHTSVTPMFLVQAMTKVEWTNSLRVMFATQTVYQLGDDTHIPQPSQGALWGFARVFGSEHGEHDVTLVDLPKACDGNLITHFANNILSETYEQEIALRDNARYVNRLRQINNTALQTYALDKVTLSNDDAFHLNIAENDNAYFSRTKAIEAGADEVLVRINFSNLVNVNNDKTQAVVLSGKVISLGENANVDANGDALHVDNDVLVLGESTQSSVVCVNKKHIVIKPAAVENEKAVSSVANYATSFYCLDYLASLCEGETVLIHNASNSLSEALIAVAKAKKANVFATADSEEKREHLRSLGLTHVFDSAIYSCPQDIATALNAEAKSGEIKLDVVINTLTGSVVDKTIDLMNDFGRFIDLTGQSLEQTSNNKLFAHNISYHCANPASFAYQRIDNYRAIVNNILTQLADGTLPSIATQLLSTDQVIARLSEEDSSTSAEVIDFNVESLAASLGVNKQVVNGNSSYLVTGGLGGLGLVVLDWLVENGATSIALMGRSAPKDEANAKIEAAREQGVDVQVVRADVSDEGSMAEAIAFIRKEMKPLAGIIHSAGILRDGVIAQQTQEQFLQVLMPKVKGSWILHTLTEDIDLDFFVCFSSIASIVGWSGQSNYAAANAFMDTLATYRRAQGKAALTVNWGPWAEAGMAANLDDRDIQRMKQAGMTPLRADNGMAAMKTLLAHHVKQSGVFEIDWNLIIKQYANPAKRTVLSNFIDHEALENTVDFMEQFLATSGDIRETLLIEKTQQLLSDVLGIESADSIDVHNNIYTYGLNSLMALEFSNRLQTVLKVKLSSTLVMKYPTIHSLVDYLLHNTFSAEAQAATENTVSEEDKLAIEKNKDLEVDSEDSVEVEW